MDYRESLLNLNEMDLKVIYEQLFNESAEDLHQIELVESIRKEVFDHHYLENILMLMPADEYDLLIRSIQADHEFLPLPSERVFFALQSLLMFETKNGIIIPFDLAREISKMDKKDIANGRKELEKDLIFMTGALFLYGYVHRQHLEYLYRHYFNEELTEEKLMHILQLLGVEPVGDMLVLPVIREGFTDHDLPSYELQHYYVPDTFEELTLYAGQDHHRNEAALNALLEFVVEHSKLHIEELIDTARFLIIASNDANLTMEEFIKLFAKDLSESEFEMFERLFIAALEETRLWVYGGKKLDEIRQEIAVQEQAEEKEKGKKVINLDVFRKDK